MNSVSQAVVADDRSPDRGAAVAVVRSALADSGHFRIALEASLVSVLEATYAASSAFHRLPDSLKQSVHNEDHGGRGWVPLRTEPAYQPGTVAWCESFDLAYHRPDVAVERAHSGLGANVWPVQPAGFEATVYWCYRQLRQLGNNVFGLLEEVIGVPAGTLQRLDTEQSSSLMRLLRYPANDAPDDGVSVGISAHTDFELCTLMSQSADGIELCSPSGTWHRVPAGPQEVVVIVGDMLERLTNGELVATPHRVPNVAHERSSIILFCAADAGAEIAPLPAFVSAARPAKYATVTQGSYIDGQVRAALARRAGGETSAGDERRIAGSR